MNKRERVRRDGRRERGADDQQRAARGAEFVGDRAAPGRDSGAALDETPGGLQGKPYLDALATRKEIIAQVTAEIENYDAVLMTGPTSIMHFCGLPTVTVAGRKKDPSGVNETVILYGEDEYRLYEAALAIEQIMMQN